MTDDGERTDRGALLKKMGDRDRESVYRFAMRRSDEIKQGITKKLETEEDREFWRAAQETAEEVALWPAWKKGT